MKFLKLRNIEWIEKSSKLEFWRGVLEFFFLGGRDVHWANFCLTELTTERRPKSSQYSKPQVLTSFTFAILISLPKIQSHKENRGNEILTNLENSKFKSNYLMSLTFLKFSNSTNSTFCQIQFFSWQGERFDIFQFSSNHFCDR